MSDTTDIVERLRKRSSKMRGFRFFFSAADMDAAEAEITLLRAELAQRTADLAALKAKPDPLNDAVEEACGELPEDWGVRVDLERGAATVWLIEPRYWESEMVHEDETSVSDLVREAVRRAKEAKP
jgi:hypothetical protein